VVLINQDKEKTNMSETLIQAAIWLGAGGTLLIFLRRRRSRRQQR
jgi:hypothetical protein